MTAKLYDLSAEEAQSLPVDRLAMLVLAHLVETREWNEYNFLNRGVNRQVPDQSLRCWAEALNWLISQNAVARNTPRQSNPQAIFVTRLGHRVLREGSETLRATARLNVDLHSRLTKVRSQFLMGEYELAAFAAMREVEIRVRELARAESSLLGVKLMRKAFGDGGALANSGLDAGERVGIMELFAGAIGTFKNPSSHRQVDYSNPTEASEVVLLADLLMRLLDRYSTSADSTGPGQHRA